MESNITIICAGLFIALFLVVFGVLYYLKRQKNIKLSIKDFIEENKKIIIDVLKDSVSIIKSDNHYATREEYEEAIVRMTLSSILRNYSNIINTFPDYPNAAKFFTSFTTSKVYAKLPEFILDILHKNAIDIFNVLDAKDIELHEELYSPDVVESIKNNS